MHQSDAQPKCTVDLNVAWLGSNKVAATQVVFDQVWALNIKHLCRHDAVALLQRTLLPLFPDVHYHASVRVFWGSSGVELTQSPDRHPDAIRGMAVYSSQSNNSSSTSNSSSSKTTTAAPFTKIKTNNTPESPRVAAAWNTLVELIHAAAATTNAEGSSSSSTTTIQQDNQQEQVQEKEQDKEQEKQSNAKSKVPTLYATCYSDTDLVRGLVFAQQCFFLASITDTPNRHTDKLEELVKNDRDLMLFLARCRSSAAQRLATPALLDDKDFVIAFLAMCGTDLSTVSPRLHSDVDVVKAAIAGCTACNNPGGDSRSVLTYMPRDVQNSRSLVLAAVKRRGADLEFARDEFKADRGIVTAAVENDGRALVHASDALKDDAAVVSKAVMQSPDALLLASLRLQRDCAFVVHHSRSFQYASPSVRSNKHAVIQVVRKNGQQLAHAAQHLKSDRDVVAAAVRTNYAALQFVNEPLRSNRAFVLETVKRWPNAYEFVSQSLKLCPKVVKAAWPYLANRHFGGLPPALQHELMQDRSFVLQFVCSSGHLCTSALEHVPEQYRSDKQVVLAAIKRNPRALAFASEALRDSRDFVLAAGSLEHASARLRGDRQLLLDVVARCKERCKQIRKPDLNLMYAAEELLADRQLVLSTLHPDTCCSVLQRLNEQMRDDEEVMLAELNCYGMHDVFISDSSASKWVASDRLKHDRSFALKTVAKAEFALKLLPHFQDDKQVVLAAATRSAWSFQFAAEHLKRDFDFVLSVVSANGQALEFAHSLLKSNKVIALAAVSQHGNSLMSCSFALRDDFDVVLRAVEQDGRALMFASSKLCQNREIALAALVNDPQARYYIGDALKRDAKLHFAAATTRNLKHLKKQLKIK